MRGRSPDYAKLGRYLRVLSAPNRLILLRKLQLPHAIGDIHLKPFRKDPDRDPDRPISRQAVDKHLGKLQALGLVRSRTVERGNREVTEYVVDQAGLFQLVEDLRALGRIRPPADLAPDQTEGDTPPAEDRWPTPPDGPALLLVGGPQEGRAFPLAGSGPWTVGRDEACDAALPYDPFVSSKNTIVTRRRGAVRVRDVEGSRNGTWVNWRRVPADEDRRVEPGDVLGVGRSLLVFRGI